MQLLEAHIGLGTIEPDGRAYRHCRFLVVDEGSGAQSETLAKLLLSKLPILSGYMRVETVVHRDVFQKTLEVRTRDRQEVPLWH